MTSPHSVNDNPKSWPYKIFTDAEIEEFKKKRITKDKGLGSTGHDRKGNDNNWIGDPCELALLSYLKKYQKPCHRLTSETETDTYDLLVPGKYKICIDVKGVLTNVVPKPNYACYVEDRQYLRIIKDDHPTNCFVFVRFIEPERKAVIVGFMGKKEFMAKSVAYKKGQKRGSIYLVEDDHAVDISQTHHIREILNFI